MNAERILHGLLSSCTTVKPRTRLPSELPEIPLPRSSGNPARRELKTQRYSEMWHQAWR